MLSGMESSRKSISVCSFKYKNWWKLLGPGIKIKDINTKFIYKLLVKIKSWYIWFGLHIKIFKKPKPQFHVLEAWKMALFDCTTLKILDFHHLIFLRQDRVALETTAGQRSLTVIKAFVTAKKTCERSLWLPLNRYSNNLITLISFQILLKQSLP